MQELITELASDIAREIGASLKGESSRIKVLARIESERLARAVVDIGLLLFNQDVDFAEAEVLLRAQRDASETVLASLAEVSRVAAARAVTDALKATMAERGGSLGGEAGLAGLLRLNIA